MSSTEEKLTFEQMPQAVSEIKAELLCLKGILNDVLNRTDDSTQDKWMNIGELSLYHPDHPAKSTIYEWVGQHRIPVHKKWKETSLPTFRD